MQTEYQYLVMLECPVKKGAKTKIFAVNNRHGITLGLIKWYSTWRQYCFLPQPDTIFNTGCMKDICHFIKQLMEERKCK